MNSPKPVRAIADPGKLPLLTTEDCCVLFRKPELFQRCCSAGWLKPCVSEPGVTLYDGKDVHSCIARILAGETPPYRIPAKSKATSTSPAAV